MDSDAEGLGRARRAYLIAPAGFGKTYLIAETVTRHCDGQQLLLTHTHAGVRAMREKLAAMGCPPARYRVETLSGWALRFTTAYPSLAGLHCPKPASGVDWQQIYIGATALLDSKAIRHVIEVSYAGIFVDEYQDCTKSQHQLVVRLADIVPCRLLGDPLQGIFDFEDEPLDWTVDVGSQFEKLPQLQTPYRWRKKNEPLGAWLTGVRERLQIGEPVDLQQAPSGVYWRAQSPQAQREVCFASARLAGSVAAIHAGNMGGPCQSLARCLRGIYQSMEPIECADLYTWADKIESSTGGKRAAQLIDFAGTCLAGVKGEFKTIRRRLLDPPTKYAAPLRKYLDAVAALESVATSTSLAPVAAALGKIRAIPSTRMFRSELWESLLLSLNEFKAGEYSSLVDAAWVVRDRVRRYGRAAEARTVSRTLLIKGLEYDHAIVLDADKLDTKQLYVALTRGSRSLTVLAAEPIIQPA